MKKPAAEPEILEEHKFDHLLQLNEDEVVDSTGKKTLSLEWLLLYLKIRICMEAQLGPAIKVIKKLKKKKCKQPHEIQRMSKLQHSEESAQEFHRETCASRETLPLADI